MEGTYSFADGGPIPSGDPYSQSYTANVSKPLHHHENPITHAHPIKEPLSQQPATNDLVHKFKPRLEDGSEIKLEYMPSLARRADQDLLDYLQKRKVSFHFLNDIDDFLKRHPGLLKACPSWCHQLNTLPPLEAYLFFVKGYLRPARYVDGALPAPEDEQIPVHPISLEHHSHDPELYEHITDIGQCLELRGRLDEMVWKLTQAYHSGLRLDHSQVLLLTMATYAQPVDVLKYWEYCYLPSLQSNSHLAPPKPVPQGRTAPQSVPMRKPQVVAKAGRKANKARKARKARYRQEPVRDQPSGLKPSGIEVMRTHRNTRKAMARAADRGDDVIAVLIDCFAEAVQRQSVRRLNMNELLRVCEVAWEALERDRLTGEGRDIVDLVMDLVSQACNSRRPSHFHPFVNNPTGAHFGIHSKRVRGAVNQLKTLYNQELKRGYVPALARDVKRAEYRLVDVVGQYARMDGTMNLAEYEFLRQKFPWRRFDYVAEYDAINPERLDVLLLLDTWI
ncbi:hypothetical protein E4T49_05935 [Aureobasidium sp. EXF-10728]|nr:hypothetical protein E4T49_05935 [Aureobasidium sp. EXF-10728]